MADTSADSLRPELLERSRLIRRRTDPAALARLLDEWMHGDENEQRETFDFLRRALDENRPEHAKLFR